MDDIYRLSGQIPPPRNFFPSYIPFQFHPTPSPQIQRTTTMLPPPPNLPTRPPPPSSSNPKPPHPRAQAQETSRAQPQATSHAQTRSTSLFKTELLHLQSTRRSVLSTLQTLSAANKQLLQSLSHIEAENERWQTPNANLGEMYRLKDEIEQGEKQIRECHRRWDQLGDEIEEKHVEIAFGGE